MSAFKDLLVIVDTSPSCEARVDVAAALAARFGAHLTGLYISPPLDLPPATVDASLTPELVVRQLQVQSEARDRAQQIFTRRAKGPGVTTEWRVAEGVPGDIAVLHARYADLTVVGQVDPEADAPVPTDLPERVVLGAGHPVLVVPYAGTFKTVGQRVLVAWNGTREAARAVHDALPLLQGASTVTALTVNASGGLHGDDEGPAGDLARHLERHGVRAEPDAFKSDDVGVGALLLSRAADLVADLMVMGAYGHSRLREVVLGGTTREIFRSMTLPVLMAH
jgi:nucleotide-binding universal stress UspA family protein